MKKFQPIYEKDLQNDREYYYGYLKYVFIEHRNDQTYFKQWGMDTIHSVDFNPLRQWSKLSFTFGR